MAQAVPPPEAAASFAATGAQYARWGVTSFHQIANNLSLYSTLAALGAATPTIKWSIYAWGLPDASIGEAWSELASAGPTPPLVRIADSKWMLDATPIERDGHLRQPLSGDAC